MKRHDEQWFNELGIAIKDILSITVLDSEETIDHLFIAVKLDDCIRITEDRPTLVQQTKVMNSCC